MAKIELPENAVPLIEIAIRVADQQVVLDPGEVAAAHGQDKERIARAYDQLQRARLLHLGLDFGAPPIVTRAGRQYVARRGAFEPPAVAFLTIVDDLDGRAALLRASSILLDEFRYHIAGGRAVEYAKQLVPEAFEQAVDEWLALKLLDAATALIMHLHNGRPAGCVAQEILAVELIELAKDDLDARAEAGELTPADSQRAGQEVAGGIFELFEDDDVLDMFEMREPGDAAVLRLDPVRQALGVADQRLESWFVPFAGRRLPATPLGS